MDGIQGDAKCVWFVHVFSFKAFINFSKGSLIQKRLQANAIEQG